MTEHIHGAYVSMTGCPACVEHRSLAQRMEDHDAWGFDTTLAAVIAEGCRRLLKMAHGYPAVPGAETWEEWEAILKRMESAFGQYAEADAQGQDPNYDELNHGLELLKQWFRHLWD